MSRLDSKINKVVNKLLERIIHDYPEAELVEYAIREVLLRGINSQIKLGTPLSDFKFTKECKQYFEPRLSYVLDWRDGEMRKEGG